jgi:signal transduction histidine kinase
VTSRRIASVVLAALLAGAATVAVVLASDREDAQVAWAVLGPLVIWSFVGTGLYASRVRPESRTGALMVLLGFAWCVPALSFANPPLGYTFALVAGGLWGGVFLQLLMTFPSGRIASGRDRAVVLAGYLVFTVAGVPALLFAGRRELSCDDCPDNLLLIRRDQGLADAGFGLQSALFALLLVVVLVRLGLRWSRTPPLERLQLTPVYVCGLLTFLLVTVGTASATDALQWSAFIATALLPVAFLAGLLRSHVAGLDAELRARLEELRASRARLVQAGDAERRRLERDLHDGAQSRLVALALMLGQVQRRIDGDAGTAALLERARGELNTSLGELRELARGIHPPALTERGLGPALRVLAARAPVPVELDTGDGERLPQPVEIAAYFIVSEALTNVAKYARATEASVAVRRTDGRVTIAISDDGVGGADPDAGSGLRGLGDRVAALEGSLAVDSPPGGGTRLVAELPCRVAG